MQLIFVRHGESTANVTRTISNRDLPHGLSERGKAQVQQLAAELSDLPILAIYASPIPRAQETAHLIAAGRPVMTAGALREFDCGLAEGRNDEEAWALHDAVVNAWDAGRHHERIEGGESYQDVRDRFVPFVQEIIQKYRGQAGTVLLVSHGSMLHQMLPYVLSNINREFSLRHPLRNCARVTTEPQGDRLICLDWDGVPVP